MHIALIDGGSFVLPYNYELIKALRADGIQVAYFGSETHFNGEYLHRLRQLDGVTVSTRNISSSMGGSSVVRLLRYLALLLSVLRRASRFDLIALEFTPAGYVETVFGWILRRKLVFVLHNAIPHDRDATRYGPYASIMWVAREIWCVSGYTASLARKLYLESAVKMRVVPHSLMGASPDVPSCTYSPPKAFGKLLFWGTVKPYKGVDRLLTATRDNVVSLAFENIEIHGRWSPKLKNLRSELLHAGGLVNDKFLSSEEVLALLEQEALFLLPYYNASQSGVLFTLMYHGRYFVASDVGEIGQMLREMNLECLLLDDFSLASLKAKATWMVENGDWLCNRMRAAVGSLSWCEAPKAARAFLNGLM